MTPLTIQQTFDLALQHHQAGRLHEAEPLYRQILAQQPAHAGVLHLLGVLAHQTGRQTMAADLIRQAIARQPNWPEAYYDLGVVLQAMRKLVEAMAAYRQAIALQPHYPQAYGNLGVALKDAGQLDAAIAAYRQALALKSDHPGVHNNLGVALKEAGQLDAAIAAYRQAIALKPKFPEAYNNLGTALQAKEHWAEAMAAYRQALAFKPDYAEAHYNLGCVLQARGQVEEAMTAWRAALARKPNYAEALCNLGGVLKDQRRLDEAIAVCHQAIALKPALSQAHGNLGAALQAKGLFDQAIAAYRQAVALNPNDAQGYNNLGSALKETGCLDEALAAYRQAIALQPNYVEAHSNLVYSLHYHPRFDAPAIAQEHRRWNQRHAEPLRKYVPRHGNDRNPDRRLRIGYVSPDFGDHCQSLFTVPLLSHHDHRNYQIVCYANMPRPDVLTARLQGYADIWRNTVGVGDEQLAGQIRQDQIDLLVDLTLHMAGNRLLVFARKPAPVQITWLGYPASTGLTTIDYRLSDAYLDPPGMNESVYSEQTVRLPDSFWCYDPLAGRDIPVSALPVLEAGVVTFGCLNNFCKINDGVLAIWAQVLSRVANSRLLLLAPEGEPRRRTVDRLGREGIAPERVAFVPRQPRGEYLKLYHRIDVGLDSFPYNGHTTSLDSFWMGVPVVTLVGQTAVARAGWCQLSNLGLAELAGRTPSEFVQIAVDLANNLRRLQELRSTLRSRMEASPLMDAPRFVRHIEAAYRQMWRSYSPKIAANT